MVSLVFNHAEILPPGLLKNCMTFTCKANTHKIGQMNDDYHTVPLVTDVRRSDFVVIFFSIDPKLDSPIFSSQFMGT